MKKFIAILLVVATMLLCLAACGGKKTSAVVTFENVDSVTALPISNAKSRLGVQVQFNVMTVNMGQEGVYTLPIMVNGTVYDFTLTYKNGTVTADAIDGLTFTLK